MLPDRTSFWAELFWAYASGYYLTLVSSVFFDLSNRRFSKKIIFSDCSVLTDFCHFIHFASETFSFWVLLGKEIFEECYSIICYFGCFSLHVKAETSWSIILITLMLLMRIVFEFCMKWVFKCRERRMMWWDEEWTKSQDWGCPCHPKKYLRGTSIKAWGCPCIPSSSTKYQVIFQCAIFLLFHILCVILGASLFLFVVFFCFCLLK